MNKVVQKLPDGRVGVVTIEEVEGEYHLTAKEIEGSMTNEELIREVAEKVMGWRYDYSPFYRDTLSLHDKDGKYLYRFHAQSFNPIYDANHRDMLLAAMVDKGWSYQIEEGPYILSRCRFFKIGKHLDWVNNNDLGHAVVLATLAAVKEEA